MLQQIALASRIPTIDVGTVRKIREGAIRIAPDIAEITEQGARFADGKHGEFDAIIFATGFRPGHAKLLEPGIQPGRSGVDAGLQSSASISSAFTIRSPDCCAKSRSRQSRSPTTSASGETERRRPKRCRYDLARGKPSSRQP